MLAMSTAGKNADEMLKKLKTEYNALRQASITREMIEPVIASGIKEGLSYDLIEITSGAKALRSKKMKNEEGRSLE